MIGKALNLKPQLDNSYPGIVVCCPSQLFTQDERNIGERQPCWSFNHPWEMKPNKADHGRWREGARQKSCRKMGCAGNRAMLW